MGKHRMLIALAVTLTLILMVGVMTEAAEPGGTSPPGVLVEGTPGQEPRLRRESSSSPDRAARITALLADEVRHELVTLPFYGVFDWLEGEVTPDGGVTLRGQVVSPRTKSDAEARVKRLESVVSVDNQIEVLPVSQQDEQLRVALYRAVYDWNSPLFRYATRAIPPIHIIVKNGRVALKGAVGTEMDSQLAYAQARGVAGVFDVQNELIVETETQR